jgi:hypothetical protein
VEEQELDAVTTAFTLGFFAEGDVLVAVNGVSPIDWCDGNGKRGEQQAAAPEEGGEEEDLLSLLRSKIHRDGSPPLALRFRRLPLGLELSLSDITIELLSSLPGHQQPLLRASVGGTRVMIQGQPSFGIDHLYTLPIADLERASRKAGLLGLTPEDDRGSAAASAATRLDASEQGANGGDALLNDQKVAHLVRTEDRRQVGHDSRHVVLERAAALFDDVLLEKAEEVLGGQTRHAVLHCGKGPLKVVV